MNIKNLLMVSIIAVSLSACQTMGNNAPKATMGTLLGGAIGGKLGVGAVAGSTTNTSNSSTSQKTLTLILKFKDKKLDTFTYNASSF